MRDLIDQQKWTKQLKQKANDLADRLVVPERMLPQLIELIEFVQKECFDASPDCGSCQRNFEPMYDESRD